MTGINGFRRRMLLAGAAAPLLGSVGTAGAQIRERIEAVRRLIGGAAVQTSGLVLDLPALSEDGSSVPLGVSLSPLVVVSEANHLRSLHLFAARNPTPEIASWEFSPVIGRLQLSTRIRLNETQQVIAVARTSQGQVYVAEREVRITASGCLARPSGAEGGQEMQVRVRLPGKVAAGGTAEVVTLISHPMDTGLAQDDKGRTIAQRIIRAMDVNFAGAPLIRGTYHRSLSANPYLRFAFTAKTPGRIEIRWTEDTGRSAQYAGEIQTG